MKKLSLLLIMFFLLVSCGGELTPPGPGPDPGPFVPLPPDVIDDIKSPLALVIVKDKSDRTKDEIVGHLLKGETDSGQTDTYWKTNKFGTWILSDQGFLTDIDPEGGDTSGTPRYGDERGELYLNGNDMPGNDFLGQLSVSDTTPWQFLTQKIAPGLEVYPYVLKLVLESASGRTTRYFYVPSIGVPDGSELPDTTTIFDQYETVGNISSDTNAYVFRIRGSGTVDSTVHPSLQKTREIKEKDFTDSFGFPLLGGLTTDGTPDGTALHVVDTSKSPTAMNYDHGPFIKR